MARKKHFAPSELDFIRVLLDKQGIDVFDDTATTEAVLMIEKLLAQSGLPSQNAKVTVLDIQASLIKTPSDSLNSLLISEKFSQSSTLALHHAAREADLVTAKKLVAIGANVNEKDIFSSTPLHVAAMYGHKEMAEFLIIKGADINAKTYKMKDVAFTPLDLAILYAPNIEIVSYLVNKGAAPDHWDPVIFGLFENVMKSHDEKDFKAFDLALKKIEITSQNKSALWVFANTEVKPVLLLCKILAAEMDDAQYYQRLEQTIDYLSVGNKTIIAEHYMTAKNLLHAFPSAETYTYKIGPNKVKITAEGYYSIVTVELAAKTLHDFQSLHDVNQDLNAFKKLQAENPLSTDNLLQSFDKYTQAKQQAFHHLEEVFKQGANTAIKAGQFEESEQLYSRYEKGETILLPSGWDGHAIEIILNKELNLLMVANSGQRFNGLTPGLNAYDTHFKITPEVIYSILNNQDQTELEFKKFYDLGFERNGTYSFSVPVQAYGNCAWYSQQIAQKALLQLELMKITDDPSLASSIVQMWYQQYTDFHLTTVLKNYLADPFLEDAALTDILVDYHQKLNSPAEVERAKLILNVLTDSAHIKDFQLYAHEHSSEFTTVFKTYLITNGYPLQLGADESSPSLIAYEEVITPDAVPYINLTLPFTSPLPPIAFHEEPVVAIM